MGTARNRKPPGTIGEHLNRLDWQLRECRRFASREYIPPPWSDRAWWRENAALRERHFAHVSNDDALKLAYTPDDRHGTEDRQIRTRPGKYLKRYFAGVLTSDEIRDYATQWAAQYEQPDFRLATTPDDIETVYVNGPHSCMAGTGSGACPRHPASVYGAGDLGVAYLGKLEDASARCVVWMEKKVYSTIYGDHERLSRSLAHAGYSEMKTGGLTGARLLYVPFDADARVLVPYVDGADSAEYNGEYLVIGTGDVTLNSTDGYSEYGEECEHCGGRCDPEDGAGVGDETWCQSCYENDAGYCARCEESFDTSYGSGDVLGETWCRGCLEADATGCDRCGEYVPSEDVREIGSQEWCLSCVESDAAYCDRCESDVPADDTATVQTTPYETRWCDDCVRSHAETCGECGDTYPSEDLTEGTCDDCTADTATARREALERDGGQIPLLIIAAISHRSGGIAYI